MASSVSTSARESASGRPSTVRTTSVRAAEARTSCCRRSERHQCAGSAAAVQDCERATHALDEVDELVVAGLDQAGDGDADLLSVREAGRDLDLADLLGLRARERHKNVSSTLET